MTDSHTNAILSKGCVFIVIAAVVPNELEVYVACQMYCTITALVLANSLGKLVDPGKCVMHYSSRLRGCSCMATIVLMSPSSWLLGEAGAERQGELDLQL